MRGPGGVGSWGVWQSVCDDLGCLWDETPVSKSKSVTTNATPGWEGVGDERRTIAAFLFTWPQVRPCCFLRRGTVSPFVV